eukprot:2710577-Amphidinium_carterae.1
MDRVHPNQRREYVSLSATNTYMASRVLSAATFEVWIVREILQRIARGLFIGLPVDVQLVNGG